MRTWLLAAAAALAAITGRPAPAADVTQLGRLDERLSPAARAAWALSGEALAGGVEFDPPADAQAALRTATITCTRRFGWTPKVAKAATEIFVFAGALAAGERKVAADGLAVATVEATARSLGDQDRQALLARRHEGQVALDRALGSLGEARDPTARFDALMLGAITVKLDDHRARFAGL